jgi:hypothetical protein
MRPQHSLDRAKQIRLNFRGDVLVFPFRDPEGVQWEGCLDEWVGNGNFYVSDAALSREGRQYVPVGSSGGGADQILIREDGVVCYFNDYDQQLSEVAGPVDEFVALLRPFVVPVDSHCRITF